MKEPKMQMPDRDMRDAFFEELYAIAQNAPEVVLLTADMGAHSLIKFKKELSSQYFNVGVAEQNMVSIAAGLALGGKRVFLYTIIPFVTLRCYEQIKIDLCCMNLPVTIVGVGAGFAYDSDGPTHHAIQDIAVMRTLPEITILNPSDSLMAKAFARIAYGNAGPTYVRMDKGIFPAIYTQGNNNFLEGLAELTPPSDLTIITTGFMVHRTLKIREELAKYSISASVVDLYRIKPLNEGKILKILSKTRRLITIEENAITGGLGSIISELLADKSLSMALKRIALNDQHCFDIGSRKELHKLYNLEINAIVKDILKWLQFKKG